MREVVVVVHLHRFLLRHASRGQHCTEPTHQALLLQLLQAPRLALSPHRSQLGNRRQHYTRLPLSPSLPTGKQKATLHQTAPLPHRSLQLGNRRQHYTRLPLSPSLPTGKQKATLHQTAPLPIASNWETEGNITPDCPSPHRSLQLGNRRQHYTRLPLSPSLPPTGKQKATLHQTAPLPIAPSNWETEGNITPDCPSPHRSLQLGNRRQHYTRLPLSPSLPPTGKQKATLHQTAPLPISPSNWETEGNITPDCPSPHLSLQLGNRRQHYTRLPLSPIAPSNWETEGNITPDCPSPLSLPPTGKQKATLHQTAPLPHHSLQLGNRRQHYTRLPLSPSLPPTGKQKATLHQTAPLPIAPSNWETEGNITPDCPSPPSLPPTGKQKATLHQTAPLPIAPSNWETEGNITPDCPSPHRSLQLGNRRQHYTRLPLSPIAPNWETEGNITPDCPSPPWLPPTGKQKATLHQTAPLPHGSLQLGNRRQHYTRLPLSPMAPSNWETEGNITPDCPSPHRSLQLGNRRQHYTRLPLSPIAPNWETEGNITPDCPSPPWLPPTGKQKATLHQTAPLPIAPSNWETEGNITPDCPSPHRSLQLGNRRQYYTRLPLSPITPSNWETEGNITPDCPSPPSLPTGKQKATLHQTAPLPHRSQLGNRRQHYTRLPLSPITPNWETEGNITPDCPSPPSLPTGKQKATLHQTAPLPHRSQLGNRRQHYTRLPLSPITPNWETEGNITPDCASPPWLPPTGKQKAILHQTATLPHRSLQLGNRRQHYTRLPLSPMAPSNWETEGNITPDCHSPPSLPPTGKQKATLHQTAPLPHHSLQLGNRRQHYTRLPLSPMAPSNWETEGNITPDCRSPPWLPPTGKPKAILHQTAPLPCRSLQLGNRRQYYTRLPLSPVAPSNWETEGNITPDCPSPLSLPPTGKQKATLHQTAPLPHGSLQLGNRRQYYTRLPLSPVAPSNWETEGNITQDCPSPLSLPPTGKPKAILHQTAPLPCRSLQLGNRRQYYTRLPLSPVAPSNWETEGNITPDCPSPLSLPPTGKPKAILHQTAPLPCRSLQLGNRRQHYTRLPLSPVAPSNWETEGNITPDCPSPLSLGTSN